MQNTDTFISYRRSASMHLARNIFSELNRRGINTFLDVVSMDSTQFDTFILNQIAARPNYVLVLSPGSLQRCTEPSDWLLREIQHAVNLRRNIIPVWDIGFAWDAEKHHLPSELQSIGERNAVRYNDDYHKSFIDKVLRFIRNPQASEPIKLKPISTTEAERAQQAIRDALDMRYEQQEIIDAIGSYHKSKQSAETVTDWEDMISVWTHLRDQTKQLRSNGDLPQFFEIDNEEKYLRDRLKEAQWREQREIDYNFIRQMARNENIPRASVLKQLESFWKVYDGNYSEYSYDPDDYSERRIAGEVGEKLTRLNCLNPLNLLRSVQWGLEVDDYNNMVRLANLPPNKTDYVEKYPNYTRHRRVRDTYVFGTWTRFKNKATWVALIYFLIIIILLGLTGKSLRFPQFPLLGTSQTLILAGLTLLSGIASVVGIFGYFEHDRRRFARLVTLSSVLLTLVLVVWGAWLGGWYM